ncbi:cyclic-phosphate processing receiver domain-containing protein [Parapedobacter sp. 2B3]|uniref:cyclic-phosphate processing receiver domain-containing protein n=1 Tax=Parapedobacter sp. 2B3 TaxID=3342381 RepID=UPI0035B63997
MTYLFLDDIRHPKDVLLYTTSSENSVYDSDGWRVVRDFHQFVDDITKNGLPDLISFDHDLGVDESGETKLSGYDCAKWLIDYVMDHQVPLPRILCHSQNPVGAANIKGLFTSFRKAYDY